MAEGIKNKVAIIGMGCTRFGEHWDRSAESLAVEAFEEAINDAGIEKKDINAAWLSTCFDEGNVGKSAIPLAAALKLPYLPITRVENLCASGTDAIRGACYAVASAAPGYIQSADISEPDGPGPVRHAGHQIFQSIRPHPGGGQKDHCQDIREESCKRHIESKGTSQEEG